MSRRLPKVPQYLLKRPYCLLVTCLKDFAVFSKGALNVVHKWSEYPTLTMNPSGGPWPSPQCILKILKGRANLKISKSALLSSNHYNFSNTEPIYTKYSFTVSLLHYLAFEIKIQVVDLLPWRQQIADS